MNDDELIISPLSSLEISFNLDFNSNYNQFFIIKNPKNTLEVDGEKLSHAYPATGTLNIKNLNNQSEKIAFTIIDISKSCDYFDLVLNPNNDHTYSFDNIDSSKKSKLYCVVMTSLSAAEYIIQGTLSPDTDDKLAIYKNSNSMQYNKTLIYNNMVTTEYARTLIVTLEKGAAYTTSCGIVGITSYASYSNANTIFNLKNVDHYFESSMSLMVIPKKITIEEIKRFPQAESSNSNAEAQPASSIFSTGYGTLVLFNQETYEYQMPKNSYVIFTGVPTGVYCVVTVQKSVEIFQKTEIRSIFFKEPGKLTIWTDLPDYTTISYAIYTNNKFETLKCEEIIFLGGQENYTLSQSTKLACIYGINPDGYFYTDIDASNFKAYSISGAELEPRTIYSAPVFIYKNGSNSLTSNIVQTLSIINQNSFLYDINSDPQKLVIFDSSGASFHNGNQYPLEYETSFNSPYKVYNPETLPKEKSNNIPAYICLVIYIVIVVVLVVLAIIFKNYLIFKLHKESEANYDSVDTQDGNQNEETKPSDVYFNDVIIQMDESSDSSSESSAVLVPVEEFT